MMLFRKRPYTLFMILALAVVILFSVWRLSPVFSQETDDPQMRVYLRLDKMAFYEDSAIPLRICVKNCSDKATEFDIYDKFGDPNAQYITFQPVIMDMKGKEAEIIIPYKMEQRNPKDLLKDYTKRTVHLGPGEEIMHNLNIKGVYNLAPGQRYRVKCFFFPFFDRDYVLHGDNELTFRVINRRFADIKSGIIQKYQRKADSPEMLPSEVIFLVLNGEKTKSLHRFIKYFSIEKYINAYPNFVRKYQRTLDEKKSKIEDEFITFLIRERADYITDFKIKREDIDVANGVAYVDAYIDRFAPGKSFRYLYHYTLEKSTERYVSAWLITNLEATVVKGEMR
jgi:hypothetical protein